MIKLFWDIVFGYIELNKFDMNFISFVSNNFDALITLLVLAMSILLFIKNTIAAELTGLLCVGIFIVTGVLTPEKALAGFGSPSLITLMGLFAVSSALFKSGALDRVRELISSENVKTPRKLISLIAVSYTHLTLPTICSV